MAFGKSAKRRDDEKHGAKKSSILSNYVQECHLRTGLLFASHLKGWQVYVVWLLLLDTPLTKLLSADASKYLYGG
jgi:hypothetical protein